MTEYWMVTVPMHENTLSQQKEKIEKKNLSSVHKLEIPNFKFGSLDELIQLSDELNRVDSQCDNLVRRLGDLVNTMGDGDALLVDGVRVGVYVGQFVWNHAKYPAKISVTQMRDMLDKEIYSMEGELKNRAGEYNKVRSSLEDYKRRATAGLMSRSLYDVISAEDLVLDSEHLVTLFVVVNKNNSTLWINSYSTLTDMVAPDSSRLIIQEDDYMLYSVTLFRTVVDDFKAKCRTQKFMVREFEYSREDAEAHRKNLSSLEERQNALQRPLATWLKINFSEAFSALLHIKVIRCFTESVLRYGIPNQFLLTVLHPSNKTAKKLKAVLFDLYSVLDDNFVPNEKIDETQLRLSGQGDYYPFAFFKINLDWH